MTSANQSPKLSQSSMPTNVTSYGYSIKEKNIYHSTSDQSRPAPSEVGCRRRTPVASPSNRKRSRPTFPCGNMLSRQGRLMGGVSLKWSGRNGWAKYYHRKSERLAQRI